jgi:hypothetical protein
VIVHRFGGAKIAIHASSIALSYDASHCSGKTSMLFHLSCRAAAQGRSVVWLCSQARLEQSPPLLPRGLHRSSPALASIAFK